MGLPNVGKSTLFNCLSNAKAQSANFPFCTIEPNVGVISVPDDRLTRLVEMCSPRSVVPATGFHVFEQKLVFDYLLVAHGVDRAVDMRYVVVVEAAQHVQ